MKKSLILLLLIVLLSLTGCGQKTEESPYKDIPKPTCVITMASGDTMTFTLDPASAPNTVSNFINLANAGFYDGMKIDYVYPTYFVKSGDPAGDGTGEPGYSIAGEFSKNGYPFNNISHERGVISMCRLTDDYNSAGCQFLACIPRALSITANTRPSAGSRKTIKRALIRLTLSAQRLLTRNIARSFARPSSPSA